MRFSKHVLLHAFAICFLLFASTGYIIAQRTSGTIIGTVAQASGAHVVGASIAVTNIGTGATQTVETDAEGEYQFVGLAAGAYKLKASSPGFKAEVRTGVDLTVGATITINFSLQLGSVSETVVVTDEAPQVDTSSPTVSGLVGEHAIRELPLNGRDWLQLATLQAGVTGGLDQQATQGSPTNSRAARGNGENLYITGNRPTENLYLVDGVIVNDYANGSPGSGLNINLGVDAVREFSVLTSGFSAQYGMTSGGVVNAVFKSGTNQLHGTAFGFFRNSALDTRNYFDGPTVPPFHRYQYGAAIGGPIKKDKTFFFGNFEGLNQALSLSENSLTLSDAARNGIVPNPNGSGNMQVAISPATAPFLALFPVANGRDNGDGTAFYNFPGAQTGSEYYAIAKIDHTFSEKTNLSSSFQFDTSSLVAPDPFNQKLTGSPAGHDNFTIALQHFFNANILNTARLSISHTFATDSEDTAALSPLATNKALGFIPGRPVGILTAGALATAGGLGASGADIFHFITYQAADDLSWIRGRNTFQFGFNFERIADNFTSVNTPFGEWDYGSVQDLLQNVPQAFSSDFLGTSGARSLRTDIYGTYAQDVIRFSPKLTLTAGLRYEMNTPVSEANGKVSLLLNLADPTPHLGGTWVGKANRLNFAPRVGVAYDPFGDGKTSVRASYGIYDVMPLPYLFVNRTHATPFFGTGVAQAPAGGAFPTGGLDLLTPSTAEGAYVQQNPPRGYNQAWNLTLQRQLTSDLALTLGYVGSHSVHIPVSVDDLDQVPLSDVSHDSNGHLHFPVPAGCDVTPIPSHCFSEIQRINPNFGRIDGLVWNDFSAYHGMLINLSRRLAHGLAVQGTYTWSKSIDEGSATFSDNEYNNTVGSSYAFDLRLQKGPSDYDITNNTIINAQWNIPKPANFSGKPAAILGGWQLGGIFQYHSGVPFSVRLTSDQALTGNSRTHSSAGGQRPNFNPGPGCSANAVNPGQPSNYIKATCFSFPAPGELGDLGRNTLRGPSFADFDSSLFKNLPLFRDRYSLQLRAEFFNVLNHTNFGTQATGLFDKSGGLLSSAGQLPAPTLTTSRQIQFGAKFIF
jgi:Carboxypeptidase regulatory-like domain/TonB-dependent Receptor Plug Domain/TonB dependent receptor